MADFRLDLNNTAMGDLALRSEGVRNIVQQEGERRTQALVSAVGAENVDSYMGGDSRARYTIRRLESLQEEAKDGLLSKTLNG